MIFACVNSGHYVIIESNAVIANVQRKSRISRRNPKWRDTYYEVSWLDGKSNEFRVLTDVNTILIITN